MKIRNKIFLVPQNRHPYQKKMHRRLTVLLCLLLFLAASHQIPQAKESLVKKAQREMDFMQYEQAARYFEQAVLDNPDLDNARAKLAFCYFKLGEYDRALKALEQELALFPENLNALILLGYVHFIHGQEKEAAKVCQGFDAALKLAVKQMRKKRGKSAYRIDDKFFVDDLSGQNPNLGLPDYILGLYHKKNRNFKEAGEYFQRAFQRGYGAAECYLQLISLEFDQGEWEKGLAIAKKAIDSWSPLGEFYFMMGCASYQLKEIEAAISNFKMALELRPYLVDALKNLAKIYYNQRNFSEAIPLLTKTLKIIPYDSESELLLERSLKKRYIIREEDRPKLRQDIAGELELKYRYVFETDINLVLNAVNANAIGLIQSGKLDKAKDWLRCFLEVNDQSASLNYNLAKIYELDNELGKALRYALRAKELKKDYKDAYDLLGSIFFKLQDFEKSLQFYENVIALDPKDAMSYYNIGCVHFSIKNYEKAEENWKKAIDIEKLRKKEEEKEKSPRDELKMALTVQVRPISFEAHKSLALLYLQQGLKEKALEEFERANEIEPDDPEPYFEIGKIYYELKETAKAKFYFDRYLYLGGKEEKVKEILKSKEKAQKITEKKRTL